ncbi:integrase catalytic domain-containing protein [Trichonephila clavata]|uniref:Integrase catalytic domain-containing protein n=1 Tax=Trichonephila clavata TaxID=2740835 RepID=A0A8X6GV95_TRICU|nr:integrase catalytic domain-containing protein [Trichonephila clavata]
MEQYYTCDLLLAITNRNEFHLLKKSCGTFEIIDASRLELTAALLSARLAKQVSSYLKFNANIYYWTDSLISYYWMCGDSSAFKPYIKNRVQEIQLFSDPSQWGHCPGKDNPADLISRELLVIREHERIGHCGVSATLTQLRKNYWIPKGRQLVKTIIRICLICKKYNAKPADQLNGQLPRDRITQSPPFQIVGIDFTGAILVKDNQETHKSYVSLFTCAVTRAVNLELVSDMSTKCFFTCFTEIPRS